MAAGIADSAKIVDLGPDFRLADAGAWARYYGGQHAGRWTTGLPELPGARERIRAAGRVAAPGCYATAAILALAPLVAAGLAEPDDVVIVAASGTSGAGRAARADLLGSEVMGSVSAYQAGGAHRHIPEIEQALAEAAEAVGSAKATGAAGSAGAGAARTAEAAGAAGPAGVAGQAGVAGSAGVAAGTALEGGCPAGQGGHDVRVCFTPLLAPMPRGILATCTARLTAGFGTAAIRSALAAAYDGEPFVCLLPDGRWPGTGAVAGSNGVHLQAAADPGAGRVTVAVAIDNLGKGAAGQAIQDANLMLGLAETAGLTSIGVAP
jgi:N-acetyl-gamma-glutamyl-phosphate reductase